jgi:hypothetical protein
MKSFISVLAAVLCFCSFSYGQWAVGPKVSYGTILQGEQSIRVIPNSDKLPTILSYLGGSQVYSAGFTVYNNIGPAFIQFEAQGTKFTQSFSVSDYATPPQVTILDDTQYFIELPVTAGINYYDFRIGVGPILEIAVDRNTDLAYLEGYEDKRKKFNGSFQALLGYNKGIFNMDVRYVYKFSSIVDDFALGNDQLKLNRSANRLSFSVGMLFGGKNNLPELEEETLSQNVIMF